MKLTTTLLMGMCFAFLPGCALFGGAANPTTEVGVSLLGGFRFFDSKDNDISIKNAKFNKETGEFEIGELTIRNNSSDVRISSVQQMDAFNRQLVTHGENITRLGNIATGLAEILAPLAFPGIKLNGPLGGSAEVNTETTKGLVELMRPLIEKAVNDAIKKASSSPAPPDGE